MGARIFVGNLSFETTEERLRLQFVEHGRVNSCSILVDHDTGRSRGFGFVEMATQDEATRAIQALNGTRLDGRPIRVQVATGNGPR